MLNIILLGPQGCGKGTQAKLLIEKYHLEYIEMGAIIRKRAHLHSKKAEILDHLVNKKGVLLPDGVVLDIFIDEFEEKPISPNGYLFDGFPRSTIQYDNLKICLHNKNLKLSHGIYIKISDSESVKRLLLRGRIDDNEETIKKRLSSFHLNTQPLISALKNDGIFYEINGEQSIDAIFSDIQKVIAQ